jgi:glycosyltransferase involved in cell wall biosynthesis
MLKLLLVGPFPPPHGGVSVHVLMLHDLLREAGISCRVLNISRGAPQSDRYVSIRGPLHFMLLLLRYSLKGWSLHVHINGHNVKSWLVAFVAGLAGVTGPGAMLTIHSGMSPAYLNDRRSGRLLAWAAFRFYRHIIAVNSEIKDVLCSLSVPEARIEILPAFLPDSLLMAAPYASGFALSRSRSARACIRSAHAAPLELPGNFESWSKAHNPVLSTALFFRPEYGFGLLVQAISELREKHPRLGCVVMGDSESRPEGLPQHIFAIGDVKHESCLAVIARSDIFVRATFSDGDAISVREAIALGTPVVASDVVRRPAGTLCFKTGDASDLASKIESLLSGGDPHPHVSPEPGSNGIHRLLELYGSSA